MFIKLHSILMLSKKLMLHNFMVILITIVSPLRFFIIFVNVDVFEQYLDSFLLT